MISKLRLINFRGFEHHEVQFRPLSIVVGANNAGKSTIVEALRLVSLVSSRFRGLAYVRPPEWLDEHKVYPGVRPSLKKTPFSFHNIFHRYSEPPGEITAEFSNGCRISVYLGDGDIFANIFDAAGNPVRNKQRAQAIHIPSIEIMPQIEPLREREEQLNDDYVLASMSSRLSSSHFRNQLRIFRKDWPLLQDYISATWPNVMLDDLLVENDFPPHILHLELRNEDFVAELGTMGHGLQMWLQTMWFLCRSRNSDSVILDEPDVYMHADLQRRLIRFIKGKFPQTIVTTHSIEIMAEIEASDVLIVDRKRDRSQFANSDPAVQNVVSKIGSAHNLQLSRLWRSRKLILVEGKDIKFLKIAQNILFQDSQLPFDVVPHLAIGGWDGWHFAVGSSMAMRNSMGQSILTYCIFDRDYHIDTEIAARYSDAEARGVSLHIWNRKEIENYAICPPAIYRLIAEAHPTTPPPSEDDIKKQIATVVIRERNNLQDNLAAAFLQMNKSEGLKTANRQAREHIASMEELRCLSEIISGKTIISHLSAWSQQHFGVSFNAARIFYNMQRSEFCDEFRSVIDHLEKGSPFTQKSN